MTTFPILVQYIKKNFKRTKARRTNPDWDRQLLLRFSPETKARLEKIAARLADEVCHDVYPMQVAAILVELALNEKRPDS